MVLQKHPNGLSARAWNQLAPDSLLSRQSNRPTRPPFRWSAADHGDYVLALRLVQQRLGAMPLAVIERTVQATAVVAVSNLADGFRREGKRPRYLGRSASLGELPERQGAYDNANLHNAGSQDLLDTNEISRLDFDGYRAARHAQ